MGTFQYQGLTEPILPPSAPEAAPDLSWLPVDARPAHIFPTPRSSVTPILLSLPNTVEVRDSQNPIELQTAYAFPLTRVSQAPIEIITQYTLGIRQVRTSQMVVEICYPFGCFEFRPGPPAACPVGLEPGPNASVCADDAPVFFPVE